MTSANLIVLQRDDLEDIIRRAATAAAQAVAQAQSGPRDLPELWTVGQVAGYLGVSAHTVAYRYASRRGFPAALNVGAGQRRQRRRWMAAAVRQWAENEDGY